MKRFLKFAFAAILAVGTIATVFAFTSDNTPKVQTLAVVQYQYIGPLPPTTTSVNITSNWSAVTSLPLASPLGTVLYGIRFDTDNTTLAQAIQLVRDNLSSISNGATFTSGTNSVTVFLRED